VIEAAIRRDYRRREHLGQSLTPLNRQAALMLVGAPRLL
jgi:hypothetical protein